MKIKFRNQRVKSRYFERSLRFSVSFIYFAIFITYLFQIIYYNFGLSNLSTTQWIVLGGGYFSLILFELIEGLFYPKKPSLLLAFFLTGLRIIIYILINMYDPTGISSSILGYILFTLCFYAHPLAVMPILLLVLYIFYQNVSQFWIREDVDVGYIYELFSFVLFYLFGFIIRMDDRTRQHNQKMILQLEDYASNSINLGKQEERNRISRDLHDNLGHQLVAVNIQLQKAIAYREINVDESLQSMNTALQAVNEAMGELRQTIKNLREFEVIHNIEEELEKLVQHVRENGIEVHYSLTGKTNGFSEFSLYTLRQIIQEGLTNIEKHSQATQTELSIVFQNKKILVKIIDNGIGFHPQQSMKQNHFGLLGIQERLELIGGSIKIKSKPSQGTTLIIEIPKKYPVY